MKFASNYFPRFLLTGLAVFSAGCASNSAMVIAQRYTTDSLSTASKIALTGQSQPRPEEQVLRRILTAELEQAGFDVVSPTQADYTLGGWLDDSWHSLPSLDQPVPTPYSPSSMRTVRYGAGGYHYVPDSLPPLVIRDDSKPTRTYLLTKGIRLRLYPNHGSVSEKLSPVWEGYIEMGLHTSPERETEMVKTLLAHFGQDFNGRVRLNK